MIPGYAVDSHTGFKDNRADGGEMIQPLDEFLKALSKRAAELSQSEESTKQCAVLPTLSLLGWNIVDPSEVQAEFQVGNGNDRVDYCLKVVTPRVFVEAKKAGEQLSGHEDQLLNYTYHYGVELAALTNGLVWWLYLPLRGGRKDEKKFAVIDVERDTDAAEQLLCFFGREAIKTGSALVRAQAMVVRNSLPRAWTAVCAEHRELLEGWLIEKVKILSGYGPSQGDVGSYFDNLLQSSPVPLSFGEASSNSNDTHSSRADCVLEILRDGEWHTASELRSRLQTSHINELLYSLRDEGRIEFQKDSRVNTVRLVVIQKN